MKARLGILALLIGIASVAFAGHGRDRGHKRELSSTSQKGANANNSGAAEVLPTYDFTPDQIAGSRFYLTTGVLDHMHVATDLTTDVALVHVASAGDAVGRIATPVNGHVLQAGSSGTRCVYRAGPHFECDGADDRLAVNNSAGAFNFIHQTLVFSILMRVGVFTDGAAETILDNNNATGANAGINVTRNAAGTLNIFATGGGLTLYNCNTVETILNADDVVPVVIRSNNVSGLTYQIDGGTVRSCARTNAPSGTANAGGNLTFGARFGGTSPGNVEIRDVLITNTVVSDPDVALWAAFVPGTDDPATYVRQSGLGEAAGEPWFTTFLHRHYDFTNGTAIWEDAARTAPANVLNDPIRVADHVDDPDAAQGLNREARAATDAERPLFTEATGALFDGDTTPANGDDLLFDAIDVMGAGDRTWCVVARHDNVGNPSDFSHIANAGSGYWSLSGDTYVGNPGGDAYNILHFTVTPDELFLGNQTGFNIMCWRRTGATQAGRARGAGVVNNATGTSSDPWNLSGLSDDDVLPMDGEIVEFLSWQAVLTDDQVDVVINGLVAKHATLGL